MAAIVAAMAFNFNMSENKSELSPLALANIEALAADEEFGITCGASGGNCWRIKTSEKIKSKDETGKEIVTYEKITCEFSGWMKDSCTPKEEGQK